MPIMRFRAACLTHLTAKMEEGGPVFRLHFRSDLSDLVAQEMHWDILDTKGNVRSGFGATSLEGALTLDNLSLNPNGLTAEQKKEGFGVLDVKCRLCHRFGVSVTRDAKSGKPTCYLSFTVVIGDNFGPVDKWWRKWGTVESLLSLSVIEQVDVDEEAEEDTPAEKPKRSRKGKQGELLQQEQEPELASVV